MNRQSLSTASLVALLALGATACGSDDQAEPGGSPSTSTADTGTTEATESTETTETADADRGAAFCAVITDERLSEITGRPQTVGGATSVGSREECRTVRDPDDALEVRWSTGLAADRPLQEVVDSEGFGLDASPLELTGGDGPVEATLLQGELGGAGTAVVVVAVDDQVVVAAATSQEAIIGGSPIPAAELRRVATEIAQDYVTTAVPPLPAA